MGNFAKFVAAAATAVALSAVASPSYAEITTFASYEQENGGASLAWTKGATGGTLATVGSGAVRFSFLQPALSFLENLEASFSLTASTSEAATVSSGRIYQGGLTGSFQFIYTGLEDLVIGNVVRSTGAILLAANFTDGEISGRLNSTSGGFDDATSVGGTISYYSDFLDFSRTEERDFAFALTALTPRFTNGGGLNSFTATSTGSFSSDPAPIVSLVPEPGAWALMLIGFAGVGMVVRGARRREIVAA